MPTDRTDSSPPGGPLPRPIGALLEPLYRATISLRNRTFDRGWRVTRLPFPVISVGNLSVGGTGKTPMVQWIARTLAESGVHPAIALRGYMPHGGQDRRPSSTKPSGTGVPPVSPQPPSSSSLHYSDEAALYCEALPGVPLAIGAKRAETLAALRREHEFDCAILDDGFQHRFVARDLDVVLIDSTRDPTDEPCLPAGWQREPISSLKRADVIVYTRVDARRGAMLDAIHQHVEHAAGPKPFAACAHEWAELLSTDADPRPVEWLRGRRVALLAAIGNPGAFIEHAQLLGAEPVLRIARRDHHSWSAADLEELRARLAECAPIDAIVTTEKDWVKLRRLDLSSLPCPVLRPKLELRFYRGEAMLRDRLLAAARTSGHKT